MGDEKLGRTMTHVLLRAVLPSSVTAQVVQRLRWSLIRLEARQAGTREGRYRFGAGESAPDEALQINLTGVLQSHTNPFQVGDVWSDPVQTMQGALTIAEPPPGTFSHPATARGGCPTASYGGN